MLQIATRALVPEDAKAAAEVFFDAVHNGTVDVYSHAQREAWGGVAPNPIRWQEKFQNIAGFAADIDGALAGFMTLNAAGYIDLAFVKTDASGRGIGRALYTLIEARAAEQGISWLRTEASKKAKPFFLRLEWQVDHEQVVTVREVQLTNFKMSKALSMNQ